MSLFRELKRRNVFRAATAYVVGAWLIVQVVETVLPAFGFGETALRITVIVLAICFVPAMALSWAFELTPGGIKREENVDYSSPTFKQFGKRLDRIVMVALALALGFFAFDKFVLSESREALIAESARQEGRSEALVESYGDKSIAVLPFVDMSAEGDQEYMSDGIAEELLNLLARIPELRVVSRSSAFAFKGQNLEIPEIARRLAVAYVLEGSVRKSANRIRITAQLIDARSDTHVWSETYDRDLEDVFAIQDDVAATVVDELQVELIGEVPRVRPTDPRAYELFLQARYNNGWVATEESTYRAIELARAALEIDETYVPAWAQLAVALGNARSYWKGPENDEELAAESWKAIQRSFELAPDDPVVLRTYGMIKLKKDGDAHDAAVNLRRALELEPHNWMVLEGAANLLRYLGRYDEAARLREYLAWRVPGNTLILNALILDYWFALRYSDGLALVQQQLKAKPEDPEYGFYLGVFKLFSGDPQGALDVALNSLAEIEGQENSMYLRVNHRATMTMAYHDLGRMEEFEASLAQLVELTRDTPAVNALVQIYAYLDDIDAAFEILDGMADAGALRKMHYNEPGLENLHEDPRWLDLIERTGFTADELNAVDFHVEIPSHDVPTTDPWAGSDAGE